MKNLPNIVKFIFYFFLIYITILFLHKTPLVKNVNVGVYTALQQVVFNTFHPTVKTDFAVYNANGNPKAPFDFTVNIYSKEAWKGRYYGVKPTAIINQSARLISIIPFSFLLALVIASPSTWQRKLIGLAVAGTIILIYLSLKYTHLINTNAVDLSPDSFSLWMSLSKLLIPCYGSNEAMFIIIVPIWMLSTLNHNDLQWFSK